MSRLRSWRRYTTYKLAYWFRCWKPLLNWLQQDSAGHSSGIAGKSGCINQLVMNTIHTNATKEQWCKYVINMMQRWKTKQNRNNQRLSLYFTEWGWGRGSEETKKSLYVFRTYFWNRHIWQKSNASNFNISSRTALYVVSIFIWWCQVDPCDVIQLYPAVTGKEVHSFFNMTTMHIYVHLTVY